MDELNHVCISRVMMPEGLAIENGGKLGKLHAFLKNLNILSLQMEVVPEDHIDPSLCCIHDIWCLNIQELGRLLENLPLIRPFHNASELMCDRLKGCNTLVSVGVVRHTKLEVDDIVTVHVII